MEIMRDITSLTKEYGITYKEIMDLPYAIYLSYLKWARVYQLEQTEEGRDMLYKTSAIHATEPDWATVRKHT